MKIYTKTGDDGQTHLFGGARVSKDSLRVEAYGSVDELSASLGTAACSLEEDLRAFVVNLQHQLFNLGSELATVPERLEKLASPLIDDADVARLEQKIDALEAELAPLRNFIIASGSDGAARLHVARTVCRRAERRVTTLAQTESCRPVVGQYLNRLSDLLFVMARTANKTAGVADIPWKQDKPLASATDS